MKIGAGGLQSMLTHDHINVKQMEPGRGKISPDNQQMQHQNLAQKPVNVADIFKAVDRLNQAAQMFNHPLQFKVVRDREGRRKVQVYNKKTGETHQLEPEQVAQLLQQQQPTSTKGKKIDDYA